MRHCGPCLTDNVRGWVKVKVGPGQYRVMVHGEAMEAPHTEEVGRQVAVDRPNPGPINCHLPEGAVMCCRK